MDKLVADNGNVSFDWGIVLTMFLCLFLAGSLFLFIRNNNLLANGGQNLWHPETLVMLGVLGTPFVFTLIHVVRSLRRPRKHTADISPE
jgi:hypothetical protein